MAVHALGLADILPDIPIGRPSSEAGDAPSYESLACLPEYALCRWHICGRAPRCRSAQQLGKHESGMSEVTVLTNS